MTLTAMATIVPLATSLSLFSGTLEETECSVLVPVVGVCLISHEDPEPEKPEPSPSPSATQTQKPTPKPAPTQHPTPVPTKKPVVVAPAPSPSASAKAPVVVRQPQPAVVPQRSAPKVMEAPVPPARVMPVEKPTQALAVPSTAASQTAAPVPSKTKTPSATPKPTTSKDAALSDAMKASPSTSAAPVATDMSTPEVESGERADSVIIPANDSDNNGTAMVAAGVGVILIGAALMWFALFRLPAMINPSHGKRALTLRGTH